MQNLTQPHYLPSFPAWNSPRLDHISRLLEYCSTLQDPAHFTREYWTTDAMDALGLSSPTSAKDLKALQDDLSHLQELTIDRLIRFNPDITELLTPKQHKQIREVLATVAGDLDDNPFEVIMARWEQDLVIDTALNFPATLLANSAKVSVVADLVDQIQRAIQWYGPDASSPQSPIAWVKLLRHALALTLDPERNLLGFDFERAENADKSIGEIFDAFDAHLLESTSLNQEKYLRLARYLLMPSFPSAFQVSDLPLSLVFQKSTLWAHFQHGVNLTELIEPGSSARLSYTELFELPLRPSTEPNNNLKHLNDAALAEPVLNWAIANGFIDRRDSSEFNADEITLAFDAFKTCEAKLVQIHAGLSTAAPVRFDMAKAELAKHGIAPELVYTLPPAFTNLGRLTPSRQAWDLYVSGEFAKPDTQWRPSTPVPDFRTLDLPDISARFETDYAAWLSTFSAAMHQQMVELFEQLPHTQRNFIYGSRIKLYSLRKASGKTIATDETTGTTSLVGRTGLLIEATKSGDRRCYEVFPYSSLIVVRDNKLSFTVGGKISYPEPGILPGPSQGLPAHPGWHSGTLEAFDWAAYATSAQPRAGERSRVIIEQFAELNTVAQSWSSLLRNFADLAISRHFLHDPDTLRKNARGTAANEKPHGLITFLKHFVIPFWAGTEDIIQGIREDRPGLVRRGIGFVLMDLAVIAPVKNLASTTLRATQITHLIARRAALRGYGAGMNAALICARSGLKVNAPQLIMLARVATRDVASIAVPFYGLFQMFRVGGPKLLRMTHAAHAQLRRALKLTRREYSNISYPAGMTRVRNDANGNYLLKGRGDELRRVNDQRLVVTRTVNPASGKALERYLVDLHSAKPYGPRLMRINDEGAFSTRMPHTLPVNNVAGQMLIHDPSPAMSKRWIRWGDELYLDMGDVLYQKVIASDGRTVLRQLKDPLVSEHMPVLSGVSCRVARSGRNALVCLVGPNESTFPDVHSEGREVVPWFEYRTISTTNNQYVYNNTRWRIASGNSIPRRGRLRFADYNTTVTVQVLGGNDVFKAIKTNGSFYPNQLDSHTLSAVLARRKSDNTLFLVTQAAPGVFYKGQWAIGNREVTMSKISISTPLAAQPTEDDYLGLIYTGSYDAHIRIKELGQEKVDNLLVDISSHLDRYHGLPEYDALIGGHFDVGTTPSQAALFCHFTQMRLNASTRASSLQWSAINASTADADLEDIAQHLNRLVAPNKLFDRTNVLNINKMKKIGEHRNVAYLKLTFKDPNTAPLVYFSLSGLARSGKKLSLTRFINGSSGLQYPGWQRIGQQAVAPDGVRYVNARPTAAQLKARPRTFTLPEVSTPKRFLSTGGNPRSLDSEKNIMEKMKADAVDFDSIASADLFSKYPTCPSCTETMRELQSLMPKDRFRVFEGLANNQAPV